MEDRAMLWSHLTAGVGHYESFLVECLAAKKAPPVPGLTWASSPPSFSASVCGGEKMASLSQLDDPKLLDRVCHCLVALGDLNRYLNDLHAGVGAAMPYSSMGLQ
jgi:hypothetical protein